mmetsp:Transcript_20279/g.32362  ORF Transcript_20279/g.32362 Transcript_20279/m.32362 type:complete len:213 (-) Transcript_20279:110-748(-)
MLVLSSDLPHAFKDAGVPLSWLPGDHRKLGRNQCVHTKIDVPKTSSSHLWKKFLQPHAVCCDAQRQATGNAGTDLSEVLDYSRIVSPNCWLATSEPNLSDTLMDEQLDEPLKLLSCQQLTSCCWREDVLTLLGHAIRASQIAAVRERNPEVAVPPAKSVCQRRGDHTRHSLPSEGRDFHLTRSRPGEDSFGNPWLSSRAEGAETAKGLPTRD